MQLSVAVQPSVTTAVHAFGSVPTSISVGQAKTGGSSSKMVISWGSSRVWFPQASVRM